MRPLSFTTPDTANADVTTAVNAKIGRMFGEMVNYSIRVATWRDSFNKLWKTNTTLTLLVPDAMIYNEYEFIIRNIGFEQDGDARTATLDLVLPGSFSGQIPSGLPWDD